MSEITDRECYAMRRVNPFVGALHILETPQGRALTVNGVAWELELLTAVESREWGSLNRNSSEVMHCRYGLWSDADGVVRYPYQAGFNPGAAERQAGKLTQAIREAAQDLPFTFRDTRELWLLDQYDKQPIALLASMNPQAKHLNPMPKYWKASLTGSTPSQQRFPRAHGLEEIVRRRAGFNLERRWVDRQADGSGIVNTTGEVLEARCFPPYLLTQEWSEHDHRRLADDFIAWTAPTLLTLQHLSTHNRGRLDRRLRVQARSIEHHWRLYPQVLDDNLLTAARVQCRLMDANQNSPETASGGSEQYD